jgi:hypothetical protein
MKINEKEKLLLRRGFLGPLGLGGGFACQI